MLALHSVVSSVTSASPVVSVVSVSTSAASYSGGGVEVSESTAGSVDWVETLYGFLAIIKEYVAKQTNPKITIHFARFHLIVLLYLSLSF